MRIENPSRVDVAIKVAQQPFQQSCFSRSGFACNDNEALAGGDPVTKRRKRFVIAGVGKENPRIRRDIKRRLAQLKVILVHKDSAMTIWRNYTMSPITVRRSDFKPNTLVSVGHQISVTTISCRYKRSKFGSCTCRIYPCMI